MSMVIIIIIIRTSNIYNAYQTSNQLAGIEIIAGDIEDLVYNEIAIYTSVELSLLV